MARKKKIYFDHKKAKAELFTRTEGYAAKVRTAYRASIKEIINLVKGTELVNGVPFSFSDYGYDSAVTPILRSMYSQVYQIVSKGAKTEWLKSNENNDELIRAIFGEHSIENNFFARYFERNMVACDAFIARKSGPLGLDLSQRVWNYTKQHRKELEGAIGLAISEGTPANALATKIQKYLNDPDRFYRRFRVKVGEDEDGNPVYGRIWKRRIFDNESGSYKWINDDPKDYHPGRGVYRSSYRNAQRLARTETNIAYRTADYDRWDRLDFVVGIEIKLSNNHPVVDICDDLKGVYPKTFKWTGWHPNCRCYMTPVLASQEELDKMIDKILDGENPAEVDCAGTIKEMPTAFVDWTAKNAARIAAAEQRGTLPYFLSDNTESALKEYRMNRHFSSYKTFDNGGVVQLMNGLDATGSDYKPLLSIARAFAENGSVARITTKAHFKSPEYKDVFGALFGTKYERKCPDLIVDGKFYEFESFVRPWNKKKVGRMISHGTSQSNRIIIDNSNGCSHRFILTQVHNRLRQANFKNEILELWVYEKGTLTRLS